MEFRWGSDGLVAETISIALAAGSVILEVYATDFAVATKAASLPVTEADRRGEAVILAGLARLAPEILVVAEEECAAGRLPSTGERFFLVDPLDGTKEFLARNGEFTVNIALVEDGAPVAGVVYAPGVLDAGGGAVKARVADGALRGAARMSVRAAPPAPKAVGSGSHGSRETMDWLARFPRATFVSAGSSLKFCLLAEGAADIYPRFGRTMEWGTAAGDAVLHAAGGLVTTCDGRPLTYNKRRQAHDAPFANPHFLAFGDRRLVEAAVAPAS